MKPVYIAALSLAFLTACKPASTPVKTMHESEFLTCYLETYGNCYDSVPYNVIALDLYSEGITLNEQHKIQGTGTNLYISDIFLGDSAQDNLLHARLTEPMHFVSSPDPAEYTFLPGMDFDGNPTGIYLLTIADNAIAAIQVIDSGNFVLSATDDRLIDFQGTFYYTARASGDTRATVHTYNARFQGLPEQIDRATD